MKTRKEEYLSCKDEYNKGDGHGDANGHHGALLEGKVEEEEEQEEQEGAKEEVGEEEGDKEEGDEDQGAEEEGDEDEVDEEEGDEEDLKGALQVIELQVGDEESVPELRGRRLQERLEPCLHLGRHGINPGLRGSI